MSAPTPVSAYLHSATMVKAGIFLLARLWPVLAGTDTWFLIVAPVGLATMLIGAWIALFKDDLKAILAYSTVSQLGIMTMLLGFGTAAAAMIAVFHIVNHATFKAALFMSAGAIDHEAGTRHIHRLGGLATLMPIIATLSFIAAAAMAGIPLSSGFLSKEMVLEEAWHTGYAGVEWLFPVLATAAALFSAGYSFRFAIRTFLGPGTARLSAPPARPAGRVMAADRGAGRADHRDRDGAANRRRPDRRAYRAGGGRRRSAAVRAGSMARLLRRRRDERGRAARRRESCSRLIGPTNALRLALPRPDAKLIHDAVIEMAVSAARRLIDTIHDGSLPRYLGVTLGAILVVGVAGFVGGTYEAGTRATLPPSLPAVTAWIALVAASAAVLIRHRDRLLSLVLTSIVGLIVSLAFMQFSAPDLALTQITVDVVTTILLLLALNLLPRTSEESAGGIRWVHAAVAVLAGTGIGGLAFAVMTRNFETISGYYLAHAKPGGGGANVVNVILVDFRGFDTFGEIIVLGIAAVAIFALLDMAFRGAAARRLATVRHPEQARDAHPLLLVVATRVLLPLALTVAIYIFLRGHNAPGGGFIAGLVVAIALIMQYIASGYGWADPARAGRRPGDDRRRRRDRRADRDRRVVFRAAVPDQRSRRISRAADRRNRVRVGNRFRSRRDAYRGWGGDAVAAPDLAGRAARRTRADARGTDGYPVAGRSRARAGDKERIAQPDGRRSPTVADATPHGDS